MTTRFYGPIPSVGERVRHFHSWIDDHAVGTVSRIEPLGTQFRRGPFTFERCRVHLTDCLHWRADGTWGPVPDTYFDNLAESWSYEDAEAGLETALPAADPAAGPGPGARLDL